MNRPGNKKGSKMRDPSKSTKAQIVITPADKAVIGPFKEEYTINVYGSFISQTDIIRYVMDLGLKELEKQTAILQKENKNRNCATL